MKLCKFTGADAPEQMGLIEDDVIFPLVSSGGQYKTLTDLLEADDVAATVEFMADRTRKPISLADVTLLPPIDRQEVWAAGVTYQRSKTARMEESQGAARFYDMVYDADRPELFFKATPHRVVGPEQQVRIRQDAKWSVPEPELAVVLSKRMRVVGYTIGNDMSSRDIEGANPLYLPQAKLYDDCCALGPCILLAEWFRSPHKVKIELRVLREDHIAFHGETLLGNMKRTVEELVGWLSRDNTFHNGAILLTGTGIVPPDEFTLQPGDVIEIAIDRIGMLRNTVKRG